MLQPRRAAVHELIYEAAWEDGILSRQQLRFLRLAVVRSQSGWSGGTDTGMGHCSYSRLQACNAAAMPCANLQLLRCSHQGRTSSRCLLSHVRPLTPTEQNSNRRCRHRLNLHDQTGAPQCAQRTAATHEGRWKLPCTRLIGCRGWEGAGGTPTGEARMRGLAGKRQDVCGAAPGLSMR